MVQYASSRAALFRVAAISHQHYAALHKENAAGRAWGVWLEYMDACPCTAIAYRPQSESSIHERRATSDAGPFFNSQLQLASTTAHPRPKRKH
jgi:hypothetical protein